MRKYVGYYYYWIYEGYVAESSINKIVLYANIEMNEGERDVV